MKSQIQYRITLPDANDQLRKRCKDAALALYGHPELPKEGSDRLEYELAVISAHNYASDFLFAAILANRASELGYSVSTSGTLGSLFVAFLCGLTNVNPLLVHYHCPEYCHFFESVDLDINYAVCDYDYYNQLGFDLLDDICPICGSITEPSGNGINPKFCMGKDCKREPDIIINFPVSIRKEIIRYMKEQLSEYQFIRAGTSYEKPDGSVFKGVHPGGVFIIPKDIVIEEFTPLRNCTLDDEFQMPITVKDYHELNNVFKRYDILALPLLDILHDMENKAGVSLDDIRLNDNGIMEVFQREGFSFIPNHRRGNRIEEQIFSCYLPKKFSDIVRILGLMSGVNTWIENGEDIIRVGINPRRLISSRDDVYQELTEMGVGSETAWNIMINIVHGKGVSENAELVMTEAGIPSWYINSCRKIKYLFPKSHLIEYAILYSISRPTSLEYLARLPRVLILNNFRFRYHYH